MTTARDMIAEIMCDLDSNLPPDDIDREIADLFLERLRAAPEPIRMELAQQLLPDMKSYAQFKAEARQRPEMKTQPEEIAELIEDINRRLPSSVDCECYDCMLPRRFAAALERMAPENEELRVENAKAFARQIASEDHIKELEAERDQQGRYACELFDEVARLQKECAAIRAKTIEDVERIIHACPYLDEDGHVLATSNVLEVIRALNRPPEAEGKEE